MGRRAQPLPRHATLAFVYLRVSDPEQAKGVWAESQLSEIERHASAKGIRIVGVFTEPGESARDDARPEFRRMMEQVYAPACTVGTILVVHTSRFMRNALAARLHKDRLRKLGISVVTVQQSFGDDPWGRFGEGVQELVDQLQSDEGAVRTRSGMLATVRAGYFVGSQPLFGFSAVAAVGPGGAPKKKLAVDPVEAAVVREMFSLYLTRGALAVAAELNARGLLYRSKLWDRDRVLRVISDTALIGEYVWGRYDSRTGRERPAEDWARHSVEGIVDPELFRRVQALREQRDPVRNPGREASSPLLLAGLVSCGLCGAKFQLQTAGKSRPDGSRYEYLQCAVRRRGVGSCPACPVAVDAVDAEVTRLLLDAVFSPERCRILLRDLVEREGILRHRVAAERKQWDRERADLERRHARLIETIETADATPAGIVARLAEVEQRLAEVRERLDRIFVLHDAPPWLYGDAAVEAFSAGMIAAVRVRPEIVRAYLHALRVRVTVGPEAITVSSTEADEKPKLQTASAEPERKTAS